MVFLQRVTIKPYLKKYMAYYVQVEPALVVSDTNKFGGFLLNTLQHKRFIKPEDLVFHVEGISLILLISEYYEKNYGLFISKSRQARFNKFLFDDFNDRMIDQIIPNISGKKGDIRRELLKFRAKYGICEDDLPFTTLKKQFERALSYQKRRKTA